MRHDTDVGLGLLPATEDLLGFIVRDRAGDDDVLPLLPVHGRADPVLGGQLQRVDHPEHLVEVAPASPSPARAADSRMHVAVMAGQLGLGISMETLVALTAATASIPG